MLRRSHYIILFLVVLLVAILLKLPGETSAKLKLAIGGLFLPLFGVAGSAQQLVEKAGNSIVPRRELIKQTGQLRHENQQLRLQLMQSEEVFRENEILRRLVAWQKQASWKYRVGRVIARDPANWWRTVQIDLGKQDGVQPNFPVLTAEGLVGRVASAGPSRSQVILLGDPNLRVGAVIRETGETGVILSTSTGPLDRDMVELGYLSRNTSLKPGHTVVTSGDGGIFPAGILIGHIVDSRSKDNGLSTEARVQLSADFHSLEEVLVMFP